VVGGIAGHSGQWHLGLINTLFFSLAVGLGVSAFVTNYSRGVAGTLALLTIIGAVLPALAELGSRSGWPAACFYLAWFSPFYPFWCARDAMYALAPHKFWITLLASHFVGWICLAFASSGLRRGSLSRRDAAERWSCCSAPLCAIPT